MRKSFTTDFDCGDLVVLKTCPDVIRQVSGFTVRKGSVSIGVVLGESESWHQAFELVKVQEQVKVKGFKK